MASLQEVLATVPCLAGHVEVGELPGGLTNLNHRVRTPRGSYVVRRYHSDTGLLAIDRDNEYENAQRAAAVGVGPRVLAYLPERNTMVFEFIEGRAMTAEISVTMATSSGSPPPAAGCTPHSRFAMTLTCS